MPAGVILGTSVGVAIGAAATYAYLNQQKREAAPAAVSAAVAAVAPSRHPALKHGLPIKERVRVFQDHVVGYDPATRNPIWVLEHLNRANAYGDAQRSKDFYEDEAIPERFRCKLASYEGSRLDRGHMAPAMNHKATQKGMNDTFFLTNISPQIGPGFNRDYWARFEKFVKDTVKKSDDVYIATGPVFAPTMGPDGRLQSRHSWIGRPLQAVGVPTHFYKVVLCERTDPRSAEKRVAAAAFVLPNRPIPADVPLTSFVVPLEYLETVTGIEFFPAALAPQHRGALDGSAASWRRLGMAHRQALATDGQPQLADTMPGSDAALVPANKLPTVAELEATGLDAGPQQFRPHRTQGNGPVHLCEHVCCKLPAERFWERGQGTGAAGGVRGDARRPAHRAPPPPR